MRQVALFLLLVPALLPPIARAEQAEPNPCAGEDKVVVDALDPALPPAAKASPVQAMQALAEGGCGDAAYVVGNMYRFGPALAGNALAKDVAHAGALLEHAGLAGSAYAYADLAEMALAEDMPHEAMLWTQVHLWRVANQPANSKGMPFRRQGYNADLLQRATRAWRRAKLDNAQIQAMLDDYLARHRAELLAGLQEPERSAPQRVRLSIARVPPRNAAHLGKASGYVLFLLEVQPSGEVSRTVVESFAPSPEIVAKLRPLVEGVRLHPFEGPDPQNGVLPVVYGFDGPFSPALRH